MRRTELQSKPLLSRPAHRRFKHKLKFITRQSKLQLHVIAGSEWCDGSDGHSTLADVDGVAVNCRHGCPENRHWNLNRRAEVTASLSYDQTVGDL